MATVVFDLDGTLADTSGDLIAAANQVFRGMGHGDLLDPALDQAAAFRGGRAMLALGFSRLGQPETGPAIEAGYPDLLAAYEAAIDVHTALYPGAIAAVDRLLAAGYRTAICTNKPEALAELLLGKLGIRDRFGALVGADTLPVRKPDPAPFVEAVRRAGGNPARAVLIGDTVTDRHTAKAAGVPCVLVTFGPDGEDVAGLHPEALLRHFDDLDRVLEPLLSVTA
ncbi:HAD-IA family hydrolase [Pseudoruegeria sp. SK021]|uniref:HAD-IA family hydrolase n=1 Tax=Pseudoruegeria sp. SK021 TaxID=1933035 RepID=UPI000A2290EF|nr:HAD-IA family hydrolase [Pseudoruegeria sp. SK021]OSP54511.1 haloacid dehalogenase [Pseudoruegeria sp. SK021]